ncbi:MAG: NADH:ubiquinone reductase (Na(+)-transporting) subunit F [Planctomycetota bacterium]
MSVVQWKDYRLVGPESVRAVERGLAGAAWYTCPVPNEKMRDLLQRRDGPALRDTLLWFTLLISFGVLGWMLWGTWWAVLPFMAYGVIYGSVSDSRWHEPLHGTAFKTDWLNNALYEMASFMVVRESTPWRWSHTRHHSDTIIVGRDREIAVPRPPRLRTLLLNFIGVANMPFYFRGVFRHCIGRTSAEERTYIPEEEFPAVFFKARIYLLIYAVVIGLAFYTHSILPLIYIGLPSIYGCWLMPIYGYTQHAGLAEDVLDHRLNCRTVYMNLVNRYLYWNMNYHLEHHMFPLVPYYNLPALHAIIKEDCPTPYESIFEAYREIIPAVLRQRKDPKYHVRRKLPSPAVLPTAETSLLIAAANRPAIEGWIEVATVDSIEKESAVRFDHDGRTFAIYRTADGNLHASDGMCTHGKTHLADGLVIGNQIECPKHNGRFDVRDGSPQRPPARVGLKTYSIRIEQGKLMLNIVSTDSTTTMPETAYEFRVVSNENVATFIKELVLEPEARSPLFHYQPGQYLQLEIPTYDEIAFRLFSVAEPFAEAWTAQQAFNFKAANPAATRRNYSMASNPDVEDRLRFNIRIALPPRGQDCHAGVGSSYVFNLKQGDKVRAFGPYGDFFVKQGNREMLYIGGGAGMAPLRSHLSCLLDTLKTTRKIHFWYGARSLRDIFYHDYFKGLAAAHENFHFHIALSEPQPDDNWTSYIGLIHEVVQREYIATHQGHADREYYLCGPPAMVQAARAMLKEAGVAPDQIAFDEY